MIYSGELKCQPQLANENAHSMIWNAFTNIQWTNSTGMLISLNSKNDFIAWLINRIPTNDWNLCSHFESCLFFPSIFFLCLSMYNIIGNRLLCYLMVQIMAVRLLIWHIAKTQIMLFVWCKRCVMAFGCSLLFLLKTTSHIGKSH